MFCIHARSVLMPWVDYEALVLANGAKVDKQALEIVTLKDVSAELANCLRALGIEADPRVGVLVLSNEQAKSLIQRLQNHCLEGDHS